MKTLRSFDWHPILKSEKCKNKWHKCISFVKINLNIVEYFVSTNDQEFKEKLEHETFKNPNLFLDYLIEKNNYFID